MAYPLTTRLVFALASADGLSGSLRDALEVDWVQVNAPDPSLDGALALQHASPAFEAFVMLPGSASMSHALEVLRPLAGWRCEVREPLAVEYAGPGVPVAGMANVAVLRKPGELPYESWLEHWYGPHTQIAMETQGTFGYVQHRVLECLTESGGEVSAIVEELFPLAAVSDVHAFYGSGGDDAELGARITRLMASVAEMGADRDLDLVPTLRMVWGPASF